MKKLFVLAAVFATACSFDAGRLTALRCEGEGVPCGTDGGVCIGGICLPAQCGSSCYDASSDTLGAGRPCRSGTLDCSGATPVCVGQILPTDEVCNLVDDDCDGGVDEELPQETCEATGQRGACTVGVVDCRDGAPFCSPGVAMGEVCDGEDNDCDGDTDEGTDELCYDGPAGCTGPSGPCVGTCALGVRRCENGVLASACVDQVTPRTEICDNGLDESCTGVPDSGCMCSAPQACFSGPEGICDVGTQTCEGACATGMQDCSGSQFGACTGETLPEAETCDNLGVDNDCDGETMDVDRAGETCFDEARMGACREGQMECVGSQLECVYPVAATDDSECNGIDDDCDGVVDEDVDFNSVNSCGVCTRACEPGELCCAGDCVDPTTSEKHCGACADNGGTVCATNELCCDSTCVDSQRNEQRCGGCGIVCEGDEQCCAGNCRNPQLDPLHCGACADEGGAVCDESEDCCTGACAVPSDPSCQCPQGCTALETCCSGACSDTTSDSANCGMCGNPCGDDERCCDSECVPIDASGCEACDVPCPTENPLCCNESGTFACVPQNEEHCADCADTCDGLSCCDGNCVDTQTDTNHCGGCGNFCSETCCSSDCIQICNNCNCPCSGLCIGGCLGGCGN